MGLVAIDANVIMVGGCLTLEHFVLVSESLNTKFIF